MLCQPLWGLDFKMQFRVYKEGKCKWNLPVTMRGEEKIANCAMLFGCFFYISLCKIASCKSLLFYTWMPELIVLSQLYASKLLINRWGWFFAHKFDRFWHKLSILVSEVWCEWRVLPPRGRICKLQRKYLKMKFYPNVSSTFSLVPAYIQVSE
jgi:hypothetical protein